MRRNSFVQAALTGRIGVRLSGGGAAAEAVYFVDFNGDTTLINCGSGASIDNLATGTFTVEAWVRVDGYGEINFGRIAAKSGGWEFGVANSGDQLGLMGYVFCSGDDAQAYSGTDDLSADGIWHHVAMTWDEATSDYPLLFVDGTPVAAYSRTNVRTGTGGTDAANSLGIGNRTTGDRAFDGAIGWLRISDSVRYSSSFTPPALCAPPATDTNTVLLLRMTEGEGTMVADSSGNDNHGTLANGAWYTCAGELA